MLHILLICPEKIGTIRSKSRLQGYRSTSVGTGFLWNYYDANEES